MFTCINPLQPAAIRGTKSQFVYQSSVRPSFTKAIDTISFSASPHASEEIKEIEHKIQELSAKISQWQQALSDLQRSDDPLSDEDKTQKVLGIFSNFGKIEDWKKKENEWKLATLPDEQRKEYARLCHDLRNKAAEIVFHLGFIEMGIYDPKTDGCVIQSASNTLINMQKLLSEHQLKNSAGLPPKTAKDTLADILSEFPKNRLVADTAPSTSLEVTTQLSESDLQELLRNFIQNALNHGDSSKNILYNSSTIEWNHKPYLHFWIQNAGKGITKNDLKTIFADGGKGSNSNCAVSTGKGLFFIQQIIKECNGQLYLTSRSDEGLINAIYHGDKLVKLQCKTSEKASSKDVNFTKFAILIPIAEMPPGGALKILPTLN